MAEGPYAADGRVVCVLSGSHQPPWFCRKPISSGRQPSPVRPWSGGDIRTAVQAQSHPSRQQKACWLLPVFCPCSSFLERHEGVVVPTAACCRLRSWSGLSRCSRVVTGRRSSLRWREHSTHSTPAGDDRQTHPTCLLAEVISATGTCSCLHMEVPGVVAAKAAILASPQSLPAALCRLLRANTH